MTIIDYSSIEDNSVKESDICIIGSGMSAQILASTIKNKKIIMIESGKLDYEKNIQSLNEYDEMGMLFRKDHINRVRQLGGSANLWANQLMVLKNFEIKNRDWITKDFSWPFNFDELKSYYNDVIKLIYNKNFKYINILDEYRNNLFLEKEFLKIDEFELLQSFWPSKVEKFNNKSKFTKKVLASKNIEFYEFFTATKIEVDEETESIKSIKVKSQNKACTIKSNFYVLACGALENARVLLNAEKYSNLIKNTNTGRYFMDHPRVNLGILKSNKKLPLSFVFGIKYNKYDLKKSLSLSSKYQNDNKLLGSHAYLDPKFSNEDAYMFENFLQELKKLIKFKGIPNLTFKNFSIKKILEQIYLKLPPQISSSLLNNILRKLFERKNFYFSFTNMEVNYQSEQFPNINSRIYLSDKKDIFNQNKLNIEWNLHDMDYKTLKEFVKVMKEKFKNHPFLNFDENVNKQITDASHHSGTTRMSLNRSDGVVDKNCKVHDVKNLFITGSSVFRSSGSANPGFTNMAMSKRLGNHLNEII